MIESLKPSRTALARIGVAGVALPASVGLAACGGDDSEGSSGSGSIDLVAYSTPQQAFEEGIIPNFQDTSEGSGVEFSTSFAASSFPATGVMSQ